MDNFKAVYMILAALEKAMDYPEFDLAVISPEALQISKERWGRYIEMMADVGYIKGVRISRDVLGNTNVSCADIRITLKGLEYLQENGVMRKMFNTLRGIKEITPGL